MATNRRARSLASRRGRKAHEARAPAAGRGRAQPGVPRRECCTKGVARSCTRGARSPSRCLRRPSRLGLPPDSPALRRNHSVNGISGGQPLCHAPRGTSLLCLTALVYVGMKMLPPLLAVTARQVSMVTSHNYSRSSRRSSTTAATLLLLRC